MRAKLTTDNKNVESHERCVASADMCWCEVKNVWLPEIEKCPASTAKNGEVVLRNLVNKIVRGVL